jgi:hypothetical protein
MEWLEAATSDTVNLRLTSNELRALVNEVDVVLHRYIDRYKAHPSPDSRPVQIQLNAFPLVRGEQTASQEREDEEEREQ